MKYEMDLNMIGDLLARKARAANRETLNNYGSEAPEMKNRVQLLAQIALIRDLGIQVELVTNEDPGKELYTAIRLNGQEYATTAQG